MPVVIGLLDDLVELFLCGERCMVVNVLQDVVVVVEKEMLVDENVGVLLLLWVWWGVVCDMACCSCCRCKVRCLLLDVMALWRC